MIYLTVTTSPSLQSVSTSTKWTELWISILGGLAVAFIPFVIKFFNRKFSQISTTAERVDRHHKSNKKRLNKLDKQQKNILSKLEDVRNKQDQES